MKYILAGYTMINDIDFGNGEVISDKLGGSVFAAAGARLWSDGVAYVGVAGKDFETLYGGYLKANGIAYNVETPFSETLRYRMTYGANGAWTEVCTGGDEYEQYAVRLSEMSPRLFSGFCGPDTKGIYIESSTERDITACFSELKAMMPAGS